jgi:hypothetical protein
LVIAAIRAARWWRLWRPALALGPYEVGDISAPGGMRVVYRTQNTRVGRFVEIKLVEDRSTDNVTPLSV